MEDKNNKNKTIDTLQQIFIAAAVALFIVSQTENNLLCPPVQAQPAFPDVKSYSLGQ